MGELIPVGIRVALRNAVGGWGPYTVRELHDLFNSYGFSDFDAEIDDAGGERRTVAAGYQARIDFTSEEQVGRYLEMVSEVLEHFHEDADEPDRAGVELRRRLERAGVAADERGHLALPESRERASATRDLELATDGVWTPARMRLFMSHTSAHKRDVAALAAELDKFAFSCFVAHDAIEPSRQWQEVIEVALRTCDVLVAYVTPDFTASRWTDQEVGWALGREVVVVPLKVGADPYGFFGAYQALTVPTGEAPWTTASSVARAIATAIFRKQRRGASRLVPQMADAVVDAFCRSGSFDTTRRRFELLELIPRSAWSHEHFKRLRAAALENSQIREGVLNDRRGAPSAIEDLIRATSTQ